MVHMIGCPDTEAASEKLKDRVKARSRSQGKKAQSAGSPSAASEKGKGHECRDAQARDSGGVESASKG